MAKKIPRVPAMENPNLKFVLHEKHKKPVIVNIFLDRDVTNCWIISELDTNTNLYTINRDSILNCKTVHDLGSTSHHLQLDDNDDEGIIKDTSSVECSSVILTIIRQRDDIDGEMRKQKVEITLQPWLRNKEGSFSFCQQLTDRILRSMLTKESTSTAPITNLNENRNRILVLANPKSGKGNAIELTEEIVLPLVEERNINYDLLITIRANQASSYVANLPSLLHRYSSIAIVSGDGLLYEIYQGLITRSDWELACKIPIGIIPGGSGNGLARSILQFQGKKITNDRDYVKHCATNLVDGISRPMDLSCVQTSSGETLLSFLSFSWGFAADVDIESERLRFLGEYRFNLWSLYSLAKLSTYPAKISYKQCKEFQYSMDEVCRKNAGGTRKRFDDSETSADSNDTGIEDDATSTNLREEQGVGLSAWSKGSIKNASHINKLTDILQEGSISTDIGPSEDWMTVEDNFVMVLLLSKPWVSKTICCAPQFSGLDDGVLWLFLIREGISRLRMLQIMLAFSEGDHVKYPEVEMIPITAFRLEPLSQKGIMLVDGEQVESGIIQAEILPGLANMLYS